MKSVDAGDRISSTPDPVTGWYFWAALLLPWCQHGPPPEQSTHFEEGASRYPVQHGFKLAAD